MRSEPAPVVRRGVPEDAAACATILNDWINATGWMPRMHPPEDVERHYRKHVLETCRVLICDEHDAVTGFLAVDEEGFISALYVAARARRRGVGAALLAAAKVLRPDRLTLWTFEANAGARRFYARHGFVETGGTGGENDEGLPDVLLVWRCAG